MEIQLDKNAEIFKALSDSTRLKIIELLLSSEKLCVGKIADKVNVTASAVSQHLKVLRHAGLVKGNKIGFYMHYELNKKTIFKYKNELDIFIKKVHSKKGGGE